MMRTERSIGRGCRPASADFWLFVLGAGCALAVQAADAPVAVTPPKPVVIQPSVAMAPPPPIPEAADTAASPSAKTAKSRKVAQAGNSAKPAKQKPQKPVAKPKAQSKAKSKPR